MPKADRLETDKRIEAVRVMISRGDTAQNICRNVSAALGVSTRQVERYIAIAREQMSEINQEHRDWMLAEHLSFRRHLRLEAMKAGDLRAALAAAQDEAKMFDLYPVQKSEVSGPGGGRLTIEIVRHDDDSDSDGDEGESTYANDTATPAAIAPATETNQATGGEV